MLKDKVIVVWFSCGAASAVAAKLTINKYEKHNTVRVVNNPIWEEHIDNSRFLNDVSSWLGVDIETASNSKFGPLNSCVDVWSARKFMSGPLGAPCTIELKKNARKEWEANNSHDYMVLGFTYEEKKRHERFVLGERDNVLPVLIEAEMTKQDCIDYLISNGIRPPAIYSRGFPNANCIGCVKATSPTYWNLVRREFPGVFKARADQSREIGAKLVRVRGERIFLDELSEKASGRPIKEMDIECGIFCEERI